MSFEFGVGDQDSIVGMVHLPGLPGSPACQTDFDDIRKRALSDAKKLAHGGVDGLLIENYGDIPFHPGDVPKHTVAFMTRVVSEINAEVNCTLGVSVLWNDGAAGLSIATAAGADFVRIPVHTGVRVTNSGIIEGKAHETMRLRDQIDSEVAVLADIDVKYAQRLTGDPALGTEFAETIQRGLADGVIVTGQETGDRVDETLLTAVRDKQDELHSSVPVLAGSGVTPENVTQILSRLDGAIVGTALKENGETRNPVDPRRVKQLMRNVKQ